MVQVKIFIDPDQSLGRCHGEHYSISVFFSYDPKNFHDPSTVTGDPLKTRAAPPEMNRRRGRPSFYYSLISSYRLMTSQELFHPRTISLNHQLRRRRQELPKKLYPELKKIKIKPPHKIVQKERLKICKVFSAMAALTS